MISLKSSLLFISIATLLVGCGATGSRGSLTQAQLEGERINALLQKSSVETTKCVEEISTNPSEKIFYGEIFFLKDDSPNKFDFLTSTEKLNPIQNSAMKTYLALNEKCRQIALAPMNGLPQQVSLIEFFNAVDAVYLKLLKNEITIGEANEARVKANIVFKSNFRKATEDMHVRLRESHNLEITNIQVESQRRASILMPYLLQQQQIQAFQQQQYYQQQLQMLNINKPINTNCTTFSNVTNCVSR